MARREGGTLGADKGYDTAGFVKVMRQAKVTPHVAAKKMGSAIDGRTTRHAGYAVGLKKRKLVEEAFWLGKDRGRSWQDEIHWLDKSKGANGLHLCLLQPDPDGDTVQLADCRRCRAKSAR